MLLSRVVVVQGWWGLRTTVSLLLLLVVVVILSTTTTTTTAATTTTTTMTQEEFVEKFAPTTCHWEDDDGDDSNNKKNCDTSSGSSSSSGSMDPNYDGYIETEWGVSQHVAGVDSLATQQMLQKMYQYMTEQVLVDDETYGTVRSECQVRDPLCAFWAAIGECEKNPAYMLLKCAPVCQSCDQISFETRCPFNKTEPGIWYKEGQLNDMFTRIITDPTIQQQYSPQILSSDPWILQLDNFTTPEECQTLIDLGSQLGYKRSEDVGGTNFDGTIQGIQSKTRTSTNAWCVDKCEHNPTTQLILHRMEELISIPHTNYEYLQLLKYEETQFYGVHHDYIQLDNDRPQGVRMLTIFLYLNDVEEGGGTNFPNIQPSTSTEKGLDGDETKKTKTGKQYKGLTVTPKPGRAIIWPSVLDSNPTKKDRRTDHQALPVIQGIKYGANAWVHQRDFKTPHSKSCI